MAFKVQNKGRADVVINARSDGRERRVLVPAGGTVEGLDDVAQTRVVKALVEDGTLKITGKASTTDTTTAAAQPWDGAKKTEGENNTATGTSTNTGTA